MAIDNTSHTLQAGIIGGGQAGTSLLNVLLHSESMRVVFLVDSKDDAPGIKIARAHGIPVHSSIPEAVRSSHCDIIFEMTGVPKVMEILLANVNPSETRILPSHTWLLIRELEGDKKRLEGRVAADIRGIKTRLGRSLDGSHNLVGRINQIMSSMQMLALNASIEAAKVGVHGKGFAVVADHMTKSVESVRKLTQEIEGVNAEILQVSEQIDTALEKLE